MGDGAAYVPAFTTDAQTGDGPLEISSLGFDITPRPPDVTGLSEASADVLLRGETEKPHSGVTADGVAWTDVPNLEGPIVFCCAASGLPVFASEDLVASTTGWPSFARPISEDHVSYRPDGGEREVLCAASRTHLGHAIAEGARLRYCINAAALTVNRIPRPVASAVDLPSSLETALRRRELSTARFAMGCYWHARFIYKCPGSFRRRPVSSNGAEAVELTYDPHKWSATRNSSSSSSPATIRPLSAPSAKRGLGESIDARSTRSTTTSARRPRRCAHASSTSRRRCSPLTPRSSARPPRSRTTTGGGEAINQRSGPPKAALGLRGRTALKAACGTGSSPWKHAEALRPRRRRARRRGRFCAKRPLGGRGGRAARPPTLLHGVVVSRAAEEALDRRGNSRNASKWWHDDDADDAASIRAAFSKRYPSAASSPWPQSPDVWAVTADDATRRGGRGGPRPRRLSPTTSTTSNASRTVELNLALKMRRNTIRRWRWATTVHAGPDGAEARSAPRPQRRRRAATAQRPPRPGEDAVCLAAPRPRSSTDGAPPRAEAPGTLRHACCLRGGAALHLSDEAPGPNCL